MTAPTRTEDRLNFKPISTAIVEIINGQPTTTSNIVAEKFSKRHGDVRRAVANLGCSPEFWRRNFASSNYVDDRGKAQPCYTITRDGFAFLVTGFSGRAAGAWKERFILEFGRQAKEIERLRQMQGDPTWQQARIEGKSVRRETTDAIQEFTEYAKGQGSLSANRYFMLFSKAANASLFFVAGACGPNFRDRLTAPQLASLAMAERIVEKSLLESMATHQFYKLAYRTAADRVRQFAALIGQQMPGRAPERLGDAR